MTIAPIFTCDYTHVNYPEVSIIYRGTIDPGATPDGLMGAGPSQDTTVFDAALTAINAANPNGYLCLDTEDVWFDPILLGRNHVPDPGNYSFQQTVANHIEVINHARTICPNMKIGFYGLPIRTRHYAGEGWFTDSEWQLDVAALKPIFDASDVLFPSIYDRDNLGDQVEQARIKRAVVVESLKYGLVMPFVWHRWSNTTELESFQTQPRYSEYVNGVLRVGFIQNVLSAIKDLPIAGIVHWTKDDVFAGGSALANQAVIDSELLSSETGTITSSTFASPDATILMSSADVSNFSVGDIIHVRNVVDTGYNSGSDSFQATVKSIPDATHITYVPQGTPAGPSTGGRIDNASAYEVRLANQTLQYLEDLDLPSSDLTTNLPLVADMIHKGTARLLVFHDSHWAQVSERRLSQAIYRTWAPEKGWSCRWLHASQGGSEILGGFSCINTPAGGVAVTFPRGVNGAMGVHPANLPFGWSAEWTDWTANMGWGSTFSEMLLTDDTDVVGGGWAYAGSEPQWPTTNPVFCKVLWNKVGADSLQKLRAYPGRSNISLDTQGNKIRTLALVNSGTEIDLTTATAGQTNSLTLDVPMGNGGSGTPGAGGIMLAGSSDGTYDETVIDPTTFFIHGTQVCKGTIAQGLGEGLGVMGLIGAGGMDLVEHLDPSRVAPQDPGFYISQGVEGLLREGVEPPNIVLIHVSNIHSGAAVTDPSEDELDVNDDIIDAVYDAHLADLLTRIRGYFATEGFPEPMILFFSPWATNTGITSTQASQVRDRIHALTTTDKKISIINLFDMYGQVTPPPIVADGIHTSTPAEADAIMTAAWGQITANSRNGLLTNLVSYHKCDEFSDGLVAVDRLDSSGYGAVFNDNNFTPSTTGFFPGTLAPSFEAVGPDNLGVMRTTGEFNLYQPLPSTDFSFQFWAKTTDAGALEVMFGNWDANRGYRVFKNSLNKLYLQIGTGAASTTNLSTESWIPGEWMHYAAAFEHGVGQTFWVNGVPTVFTAAANKLQITPTTVTSGVFLSGADPVNVVGSVCQIGFWQGRALVQADVDKLYNGGAGLEFESFNTLPIEDPDNMWRFPESLGARVHRDHKK